MPSIPGLQTHPKCWKDPLPWNPSHWIQSSLETTSPTSSLNAEKFITPTSSTIFPWSDGPHNCPGQKVSQVEFVAVLALSLQGHRMTVVQNDGESPEKARARALAVAHDCGLELIIRIRYADQPSLIWKKA